MPWVAIQLVPFFCTIQNHLKGFSTKIISLSIHDTIVATAAVRLHAVLPSTTIKTPLAIH